MEYKQSESLNKPIQIDENSSKNGVYIRICIQEKEREDVGGNKTTYYSYLEAYLTKEEFKQYKQTALMQNIDIDAPTIEYNFKMNLPIEYPVAVGGTGFTYKPAWAKSVYKELIEEANVHPEQFPLNVYDTTHKAERMVSMTVDELKKLSDFLYTVQKKFFDEKQRQQSEM